jgi:hypothetical protein
MRRRAIGYALGVMVAILFVIGVVWGVLYYGAVVLMLDTANNSYAGAFPSDVTTLMTSVYEGYMAIMTILMVYWLWMQSRKRSTYYE